MKYLIYKITNHINGRYYIGRHQTNDVNDSYMGSGKALTGMVELWNPKLTATNKNQKEYKSGDCKRVRSNTKKFEQLTEQGWLPIKHHRNKLRA